jgi:hypothetical protein
MSAMPGGVVAVMKGSRGKTCCVHDARKGRRRTNEKM